ncbi:HAD-IIIC family phosphatase [Bacillus cereus group sp. N34]|uniref:HAD-IIIC family phosphatase n=1 Tax=Bacillus cereus group sp. N34 TaxID=2794595 RepID=UPI0018F7A9E4|nr:HAD-IIIC family phosphatase [Bacillus cereus group sp. N34]MBJ8015081.1 HAD-IIIC family phosphatase [Bacillus cereus group sp. N34]
MSISQGKITNVKCVVWDLDNTVWDGILIEDENVTLRKEIVKIIQVLDSRGILQSIASKNDYNRAMKKLREFGIDEYFLYPQINWNPKSTALCKIADSINIGKDTIAFIDDQAFEREEVSFSLPEVLGIDVENIEGILDMPQMNPSFVTGDSKVRRSMYMADIKRNCEEERFIGAKEEFLAELDMKFCIRYAKQEDLKRAEELTIRTNQMNTTGYTYSYDELEQLINSPKHQLFIASLDDKFGTYGKIGLMLIECDEGVWKIKLLLMSCRVMSRGVGTILLNYAIQLAKNAGVRLCAEFVPNEVNRMMYITYKFAGFQEVETIGNIQTLEHKLSNNHSFPEYIKVDIPI